MSAIWTAGRPMLAGICDSLFEAEYRRQEGPGGSLAGVKKEDIQLHVVGRSTRAGTSAHNKNLGDARAFMVLTAIMEDLKFEVASSSSQGETNSTDEEHFRRVDVTATTGAARKVKQNVAAHEAGHMLGLGDEYVDEKPPKGAGSKFAGDKASHHENVRRVMGDQAANELLVQNGPSMMSTGSEVRPGHYVYFLEGLQKITDAPWTVA